MRVLDDLSTGKQANLTSVSGGDRVELVKGDLRDPGVCQRAVEGVDRVIHLAAMGSVPLSILEGLRQTVVAF